MPDTYITVVIDNSYTIRHKTDSSGNLTVYSGASNTPGDFSIVATADNGVNAVSDLKFIIGPPRKILLVANPHVVASADKSTPPGQSDVHKTSIIATVTDDWDHPISGELVFIQSADSINGTITGNISMGNYSNGIASGVTDDNGTFIAEFTLSKNTSGKEDLSKGVTVSGSFVNGTTITSSCNVQYADRPYVIATTAMTPLSNNRINVNVTMRAIGWVNGTVITNSSVVLAFDTSGSMNWMSNTVYPYNNQPEEGNLSKITTLLTDASGNWIGVNSDDWHYIDNFTYNGSSNVTDLQIMLSSDYRSYKNGDFYYLKVVGPDGKIYTTDTQTDGNYFVNGVLTQGNSMSGKFGNENTIHFPSPATGKYTIYGAYNDGDNSSVNVSYMMMVLTNPARMGQSTDTDAAAKLAGSEFVSEMNNNNDQVGVVWFNNSIPAAYFTSNVTSGIVPLTVQFNDTSITTPDNSITGWQWYFGDGTANDTTQNPVHTFLNYGTYNVVLTVLSDGGTNSTQGLINVSDVAPVANFTASPVIGNAPLVVQFNDTSTGLNIIGRNWSFGDGTANLTQKPYQHIFTQYGNYTVTLTVTNNGGSSTIQKVNYITVQDPLPLADFNANVTTGYAPLTVKFTDNSTGKNITGWQWNFSDGGTSTMQSPTYTFANPGTYSVTLITTNDGGNSTAQKVNYINATFAPPAANFTSNVTVGNAPLGVQFTDTSTGMNNSWAWNFGDGTGNSTVQNPIHAFANPGTYSVTLTVTNLGGISTKNATNYIIVHNATPVANFAGTPTSGTSSLSVAFTDLSTGSGINSWQWNYGDGTANGTTRNVSHSYVNNNATNATYTVTLTVANDGGSSSKQIASYIMVVPQTPSADFVGVPTSGPASLAVTFTDKSTGPIGAWQWNFGDGSPNATTKNTSHTYSAVGKYNVTLTVSNVGGSSTKSVLTYITVKNATPTVNFVGTPTVGSTPLTVQFNDTTVGAYLQTWAWNFGDGSANSSSRNTSHTYVNNNATNDTWPVMLTVTNDGGSSTKKIVGYITVIPLAPVANFTSNITSGNAPLAVNFTDTSSGGVNSWQWNFSDGTGNTTTQSPTHVFTAASTYNVTLTVTNIASGSTIKKVAYITVNDTTPVAGFTANKTSGVGPVAVQFNDTSAGKNITSYQWSFGDGSPNSTVRNATHVFNDTGKYTVTLTLGNSGGNSSLPKVAYITVTDPVPTANFTANVTVGNAPLTVQFTNTSMGRNITSYQWNFGDGYSNSTAMNPVHTYNSYGVYNVTLTLTNNAGSSTLQKVGYIVVHDPAPIANFIAIPTNGNVPLAVQFIDTSIGNNITTWQWSFGDLTANSTLPDPQHTFSAIGNYTVTLTVTNDGGSASIQKVSYITVLPTPTPTASPSPTATPTPTPVPPLAANFTGTPTNGIVPLTVSYTDLSTGLNINGWQWNFGDGSSNGTQPNPVHTYNNIGNYTVILTVYNSTGHSTMQKTSYITVHNPLPVAGFTSNITSGNAPLAVQFIDTSVGYNIYGWQWNFGDGSPNGTTQNPVHLYTVPGTYNVTLTATNDGGSSSITTVNYITVYNTAPVASFTSNATVGNIPLAVQFNDTSVGGGITSWLWNFGDGNTSTIRNATHLYSTFGTYTVSLQVTNNGGTNTKTSANYITVHDTAPVASFIANKTIGNSPVTILFTDKSAGKNLSTWQWNFGDGTGNVTTQNATHTFSNGNTTNATYTVTLTVTNNGGSSTLQQVGYITVMPAALSADFVGVPTTGSVSLPVTFTDKSTGNVSGWQWNFGDGSPNATTKNTSHTYSAVGKYNVTLTVSNAGGSSTKSVLNYITVTNVTPVANFVGTPTIGSTSLNVQFNDLSTGVNIGTWAWNFGDGSPNSTSRNTSHIYVNNNATNDTWPVMLTVTNDGGSSTKKVVGYITVTPLKPIANFAGNPTMGSAPLTVNFTDSNSGGAANSWQWNFGDGTANNTTQNPVHVFASYGTYTVTLTETNVMGSSGIQKVGYIVVHDPAPSANFTANQTIGNAPMAVQFTDTSTGKNMTSWQWSFGDGYTSTIQNATHTYNSSGTYLVNLTVTNDGGSATKSGVAITVHNAAPTASFTATPSSGIGPLNVQFNDTSIGNNILSYQWNFGDGSPNSTAKNPTHTFSIVYNYPVTLTVTNDGGISTTTSYVIVHDPAPGASFTASPTSGASPLNVQFTDTSTGNNINDWQWNFGDGSGNVTSQNPLHTFTNGNGSNITFTVTLTVKNNGGNSTVQSNITVQPSASYQPPVFALMTELARLLDPISIANADSLILALSHPASGVAMSLTDVNNTTSLTIDDSINHLSANGGTDMGAGISQAVDMLSGSPNNKVIILLTDGYSQNPENDIAQANIAKAQGIKIYTIGMGMPDEATLKAIATSPEDYFYVANELQLSNVYTGIAYSLTENVATNTTLNMYTNCSQELGPDATYVANSSVISVYDSDVQKLTTTYVEPTIVYNNTSYRLTWYPGDLSYIKAWSVNYQLYLNRSGVLTVIANGSYIQSTVDSPDGSIIPIDTNEIFPLGPSDWNNLSSIQQAPDIHVRIISPSDNYTLNNVNFPTGLPIQWNVTYGPPAGTIQPFYTQVVTISSAKLSTTRLVSDNNTRYWSTGSANYRYVWNTAKMESGYYDITVTASDGNIWDSNSVHVTIPYNPGYIVLQ